MKQWKIATSSPHNVSGSDAVLDVRLIASALRCFIERRSSRMRPAIVNQMRNVFARPLFCQLPLLPFSLCPSDIELTLFAWAGEVVVCAHQVSLITETRH